MRSSEASLSGQRALVIGLAREGLDLSKFLIEHGATVRVTDRKSEQDRGRLAKSLLSSA